MKTMDAVKIAGIVAAGVVAYWAVTKFAKAGGIQALSKAVTNAAGGAAVGAVKGIGETVGIPDTDLTQCKIDIKNGEWWKASFSCPAGEYLTAVKNRVLGVEEVNPSNVETQHITLAPTGAGGGQSSPTFAANDPRRLDIPNTKPASFVNPLASVETQDFNAMGDFPLTFGN